jgi:hypothetical protein
MPTLQISLSDWEIAVLAEEANMQMKEIVAKLQQPKKWDKDKIQRIVASTVAAQIVRKALPVMEEEKERVLNLWRDHNSEEEIATKVDISVRRVHIYLHPGGD